MPDQPTVLFVCVHNAGRSQMAAAYLNHLSGGRIEVRSAGSEPADHVNPSAVEAMLEEGIDISATPGEAVKAAASGVVAGGEKSLVCTSIRATTRNGSDSTTTGTE
mgnify:CR=1 FL=1